MCCAQRIAGLWADLPPYSIASRIDCSPPSGSTSVGCPKQWVEEKFSSTLLLTNPSSSVLAGTTKFQSRAHSCIGVIRYILLAKLLASPLLRFVTHLANSPLDRSVSFPNTNKYFSD